MKNEEIVKEIVDTINTKKFNNVLEKNSYLEKQLLSIANEDLLIKVLDAVSNQLSVYSLLSIILRIRDNNKKMELFDKYIDRFTNQHFMQFLMSLDDDKQEFFLDSHEEFQQGSILLSIWLGTYKMHFMGINRDRLLNKYIDKFDKESFALILINLKAYEYDFDSAVNYLLEKTNNDTTINNIYKGAKTIYPNYSKGNHNK